MITIGSTAIKYWFPDFPRDPKDLDYAVRDGGVIWEQGAEYLQNPVLFQFGCQGPYLQPDYLATLKASHLCWNINWEKHMFDLQFLLKKGCKINADLFAKLYEFWNTYHVKNKRSDLKMNKEDFFDNAINYNENEHDELHKILNPIPVYTLTLKDNEEVELDENKFNLLSHSQKINFVSEEVMVMAYERYSNFDYRVAYSKMLKKFIISHAPLFSLQFILENFIELHKPKINYIQTIKNHLKNAEPTN